MAVAHYARADALNDYNPSAARNPAKAHGTVAAAKRWASMADFPIDPVVRVRANPELVLGCTDDALRFLRNLLLQEPDGDWRAMLRSFQAVHDDVSALEAVVDLELLLEKKGLLIEDHAPAYAGIDFQAARLSRRAPD